MRPIAFTPKMVQKIMDGSKTQTRRPYSHPVASHLTPGDVLWVRESARILSASGKEVFIEYSADHSRRAVLWPDRLAAPKVGSCIANGVHREGARLYLRIKSCRIEPIQNITEQDAMAEGFGGTSAAARDVFATEWAMLYGYSSWTDNIAVFVYEFALMDQEG